MSLGVNQIKLVLFIASLLLMIISPLYDSKLLAKELSNGTNDQTSKCEEGLLNKIVQSEENRDHKTFQVATIVIHASPEVVFKTFTDYKRAPQIFSYLKKSKILTVNGTKKTILCEAEIAGGLFKFQYILEFIEHEPNLVEWHRLSGAFKANEGYWKFEPIDKGEFTLVTYSKYVDGGLLFPQFLVKKELQDNMPVILGELKHSVEQAVN